MSRNSPQLARELLGRAFASACSGETLRVALYTGSGELNPNVAAAFGLDLEPRPVVVRGLEPPGPVSDAEDALSYTETTLTTMARHRPPEAGPGACPRRHVLEPGGRRCALCRRLVTVVLADPGGWFAVLAEGQADAAQTVLHRDEQAQDRFRRWLVSYATGLATADSLTLDEAAAVAAAIAPPGTPQPGEPGWSDFVLLRLRGARACSREGHRIPASAAECARCGLRLEGGTPEERAFLAGWLNQQPGRRPAAETAARAARDVTVLDGQQVAARIMASASACGCGWCRLLRGEPVSFARGGPAAGRRTAEQRGELEHAEMCGATPRELEEIIAAQDRKPGPLGDLPGDTVLLVAAEPGPDFEAWRHVAQGAWIGQDGEAHVELPADDPARPERMTAAALRARLAERGGWLP
jgi:hypothetical protein